VEMAPPSGVVVAQGILAGQDGSNQNGPLNGAGGRQVALRLQKDAEVLGSRGEGWSLG